MADGDTKTDGTTTTDHVRAAIPLGIALVLGVFVALGIEGDTLTRLIRDSPRGVKYPLIIGIVGVSLVYVLPQE